MSDICEDPSTHRFRGTTSSRVKRFTLPSGESLHSPNFDMAEFVVEALTSSTLPNARSKKSYPRRLI